MPKLLDEVRNVMRTRQYSLRTEKTYINCIKQFIIFNKKRHPAELGGTKAEEFLSHLAVDRNVAASTENQALAALLSFIYMYLTSNYPNSLQSRRAPELVSAVGSDRN
jgi:hypothetical protein